MPNWRGRVLRESWDRRPSLASVIASPWFAFDSTDAASDSEASLEQMAEQLATARYFALYLQDRGRLRSLFRAFRDRDPGAADDPAAAAVSLVEANLGPIAQVQQDYDQWVHRVVQEPEPGNPAAQRSIPRAPQSIPDRPGDGPKRGASPADPPDFD